MANRSYLYAVDAIPGEPGARTSVRAVAEWNWDIPIAYQVLLTGSPRLCPSTIWGPPAQAIVGDYDTGVANFRRFLAALPDTENLRAQTAEALAALTNSSTRGRYLVLEVAEIVALGLEDDSDAAAWAADLERQVDECGDIESWLGYAGRLESKDLEQATGTSSWRTVAYFEPPPVNEPPAPVHEPPAPVNATPPPVNVTPAPPTGYPSPAPWRGVVPPPRPATGSGAWAWGFLALFPLPGLSALAAALVMAIVGHRQTRVGPLAAEVGRRAANWGLTYLVATVVFFGGHVWALAVFTAAGPVRQFYPLGIPITLWVAVSVVHLVCCGLGISRARRGVAFAPPGIPFFKPAVGPASGAGSR